MRHTKRATITIDGAIIVVRGYVRDVLRAAGLKPIQNVRGFLLDRHRLPDVVAALEAAGYVVTVSEVVDQ